MPIRPFKEIPKNLVEWSRFLTQTSVTPDDGSIGTGSIPDKAVTFVKIQDVTPNRLLGRATIPAGTVQELTVSGGLVFNGAGIQRSALTGDIQASPGSAATVFRNSGGLSVIGRSANSVGAPADILALSNGHYLRRQGDVVDFGAIDDADIPATIARDAEVTAAIAAAVSGLVSQTLGTYTATLTGCTTSPTVTARYVRTGNTVTIYIPSVNATSNATTCTLTGAPAAIQPARDQGFIPVVVQNNSALLIGCARMLTTGTIDLRPGAVSATSWTNTGTKGSDFINLTYNLD